jgi:hypothetical protein
LFTSVSGNNVISVNKKFEIEVIQPNTKKSDMVYCADTIYPLLK